MTFTLTEAGRDAACEAFAKCVRAFKWRSLEDEEVLAGTEFVGSRLPNRLLWSLRQFRRYGNDAGVILLKNIFVIDNRSAAHGPSPFTARFDGTDRWLTRCFAVLDIRRSRAHRPPGSRVCAPLAATGLPAAPAPITVTGAEDPACTAS